MLWAVCAGLGLLCVCWFAGLAWLFGRREHAAAAHGGAGRDTASAPRTEIPRRILGEWYSMLVFAAAASIAFIADGVSAGIVSASMLGFIVAAVRVIASRHDPNVVTMSAEDRARMIRLLKLTAVVAVVGYSVGIVIAIAGTITWVPVWPGIA